MSAFSVRVSEDPARPLGHAIVTLSGLPRSLETFEFALRRHGFADNHLGPDGWQGAECWLQPEEVWYSGEVLKFVLPSDLAFQLENMPYRLAARGQGLAETVEITFSWPLQLEIEAGGTSGERRVVGGARVEAGPKPRPGPSPIPDAPLPDLGGAAIAIPEMPIPEIDAGAESVDDNPPTRVAPGRITAPKLADNGDEITRIVVPGTRSTPSSRNIPAAAEPTTKIAGRRVPLTAGESQRNSGGAVMPPAAAPEPKSMSPAPSRPEPGVASPPAHPADARSEPGRGKFGWLIGLLALAILAAAAVAGGGWFSRQPRPVTPALIAPPEPKPAPGPKPPPGTRPAPGPQPAPEPEPAPEPALPARPIAPVPSEPPPAALPAPPALAPAEPSSHPRSSAPPPASGSGRSLEDELNSQFDPTTQELEKRLRRSQ